MAGKVNFVSAKPTRKVPGTDGSPSVAVTASAIPAPAFPLDPIRSEEKRGPGRPAKICDKCFKSASECRCPKASATFEAETVKALLKGTFNTIGGAISILTGVSQEQMRQIWALAEGELMILTPQAAELANKYAPDFLKLFQTEIAFGVTLFPILAVKVAMTKMVLDAKKKVSSTPSPAHNEAVPQTARAAGA